MAGGCRGLYQANHIEVLIISNSTGMRATLGRDKKISWMKCEHISLVISKGIDLIVF